MKNGGFWNRIQIGLDEKTIRFGLGWGRERERETVRERERTAVAIQGGYGGL